MDAVQLPAFKSHKTVRAAKITELRGNGSPDMPDIVLGEISGIVSLLPDWHERHKPQVGGYYVVYDDGYTSYSPAKAFEEGYAAVPVDFRDRVRAERTELSGNLTKLRAFLESETFARLDEADKLPMLDQVRGMALYLQALDERIGRFAA